MLPDLFLGFPPPPKTPMLEIGPWQLGPLGLEVKCLGAPVFTSRCPEEQRTHP